ncbi:MAG: HD domain-containing protein [Promethearchaeota archaeon]
MYIENLFPELNEISDTALREKVINVFLRAIELGEWDNIEGIPFTLLIENCPMDLVAHTCLVTQMALKIGELAEPITKINKDFLVAGALLHDVGKLVEYSRSDKGKVLKSKLGNLFRHPAIGMHLCLSEGLPYEIAHICLAHSTEGDKLKRTPEAWIVHHCDFICFELAKLHRV